MKTIILDKPFPDGRSFKYHQVYEVKYLNQDNLAKIIIGSWTTDPEYLVRPTPEMKSEVIVPVTSDFSDFILNSTEVLHSLPEWNEGIFRDTAIPNEELGPVIPEQVFEVGKLNV